MLPNYFFYRAFIKLVGMLVLFSISHNSFAVFKCIDESTGAITFTDQACPDVTQGEYHPIGYTNSDSDSASLNDAGNKAIKDGIAKSNSRKVVPPVEKVERSSQPATVEPQKSSARDKFWFERRMCQKRSNCEHCCYTQFPLPN